jgi:hypothetical protein
MPRCRLSDRRRLLPQSLAVRVVLAAVAFVAAANLPALAEKPVDLLLAVPMGKTFHYKLDNQTEVNNQGTAMTAISSGSMSMSRATDAPNKNLVFDIIVDKLEMSRRMGDQLSTQDLGLDGAKVKAEVTPRGKVVKVEGVTTLNEQQMRIAENLADVLFVDLPEKPVKTGDSWTADLSKRDGSSTGSGQFTLDEFKKEAGRQVAKLSGSVTVDAKAQGMTGKGTFGASVAVDGGYTLRAKGSLDLTGGGPSINQSFEVKLVE